MKIQKLFLINLILGIFYYNISFFLSVFITMSMYGFGSGKIKCKTIILLLSVILVVVSVIIEIYKMKVKDLKNIVCIIFTLLAGLFFMHLFWLWRLNTII